MLEIIFGLLIFISVVVCTVLWGYLTFNAAFNEHFTVKRNITFNEFMNECGNVTIFVSIFFAFLAEIAYVGLLIIK